METSVYCERCWGERYVLRSVAIPVVEPVGMQWADFREALKRGWADATAAANWMMTELYARDIRRGAERRMPRMQRAYLYPEARRRFPELAPQTVVSLEHRAQSAYRSARYEVIWTAAASLPTYRYPLPLPVHNQSWEPLVIDDRPVVRVRLGDRWWHLRLKGGPRFRKQTNAYRLMVEGQVVRGELALYRIRAQSGRMADRPNSDQAAKYSVVCKMVAWLPRDEPLRMQSGPSTLLVQTGARLLLAAFDAGGEAIWQYHGDHLRRWAAEHRKRMQNLADDQKAEHRPRPSFADRRAAAALKYRNRMSSAVREIAAQVSGYAARRGFAGIEFEDSVDEFCPDFPYAALREQVRSKCDGLGLGFRYVNRPEEQGGREFEDDSVIEEMVSGPPAGPARPTADTLADLTGRGRL